MHAVPHVVVVGGGFGGLWAARALRDAPVRITLVDRGNHHLFQPLLYQVATAGLSAPNIAAPLRHILRKQKNVTVLLGEVEGIAPGDRQVGSRMAERSTTKKPEKTKTPTILKNHTKKPGHPQFKKTMTKNQDTHNSKKP